MVLMQIKDRTPESSHSRPSRANSGALSPSALELLAQIGLDASEVCISFPGEITVGIMVKSCTFRGLGFLSPISPLEVDINSCLLLSPISAGHLKLGPPLSSPHIHLTIPARSESIPHHLTLGRRARELCERITQRQIPKDKIRFFEQQEELLKGLDEKGKFADVPKSKIARPVLV